MPNYFRRGMIHWLFMQRCAVLKKVGPERKQGLCVLVVITSNIPVISQPMTWHLPLHMLSSSKSWSHRVCKLVRVNLSVVNLSVLLLQFLLACGAAIWGGGRQWHHMDPLVGDGYLHRGNQALILCKCPLQLFMLKLNMPVYVCPRKYSPCVYDVCQCEWDMREILVYDIISMKNFDIWTTLNTRALMDNILGLSWLSCWTHKECSSKIYLRSRHCFAESCKLERTMVHVTLLDRIRLVCYAIVHYECSMRMV